MVAFLEIVFLDHHWVELASINDGPERFDAVPAGVNREHSVVKRQKKTVHLEDSWLEPAPAILFPWQGLFRRGIGFDNDRIEFELYGKAT